MLDTLIRSKTLKKDDQVMREIGILSRNTRVVMLNENHWYPKHRVLGLRLLGALKENGYTHLALEALADYQDSKITADRPYPTMNSGYYIREASFGHLIRRAKDLGFIINGYENNGQEFNRELGQAKNLKEILDKDPEAKVFVYAGMDHILEEPTNTGKRMATFLKELTAIDPLTINQVEIVGNTTNDLVLILNSMVESKEGFNKVSDFFVLNNLSSNLENIYHDRKLQQFLLKDDILKDYKEELLVKVYQKHEYDIYGPNSVPLLSFLHKSKGDEGIRMSIPAGSYVLTLSSSMKEAVYEEVIHFN